ncbi:MAG: hypothetical protein IJM71_09015 [Clostridia bacterium]|nr:hypothetical protein [Clostridia bacterium]
MANKKPWEDESNNRPDTLRLAGGNDAAWQQNMAAFADAQKRAAAQLGEQLDAANLTGAGSAAIDRVKKYRQSTPGQTANMGQTANQAAVDKASKDLVSKDLMDEFLNRGKFSYNETADPLWQQYRRRYLEAGNKAMKDTLGKASALTGGYDNSYANIAAQQVNNEYAAKAADKIPELYQLALDRYNQEGQDILKRYELLYGREKDQAAADFQREQFEYQKEQDALDREQWVAQFNEGIRQFDLNRADQREQFAAQLGLDYAKFEENVRQFGLNYALEQAQLDYQRESDAKELAYKYAALAQDDAHFNANYNLQDKELNMRENGTYFDRSSNNGNTTTDKTLLQIFNNKPDILDAAVDDAFNKLRNPSVSDDQLEEYLYYKYGEDVGARILAIARQRSQEMDNDFRRR